MKKGYKKNTYVCGECRLVFEDYKMMGIHQCPFCRSIVTKPLWKHRLAVFWSLTWPLFLAIVVWFFFIR